LKDEKKVVAKVRRVWETPHGRPHSGITKPDHP